MKRILITGAAGFIGYHMVRHLSNQGMEVVGLDNIIPFPEHNFKNERLKALGLNVENLSYGKTVNSKTHQFIKLDLNDSKKLELLFKKNHFDFVLHLAAQTGVRYSVENPLLYIDNNVRAFCSLLECCKNFPVKNVFYSSSSSVYGLNESYPFKETEPTDLPLSVYAASKKSDELLAHSYSCLYKLPTTGLRFFTVYGPWTRTNMAVFLFIKAIYNKTPINLFNNGEMYRDFTYVGDVAQAISCLIDIPYVNNRDTPFEIYNVGNQTPVKTIELISTIEKAFGKKAIINTKPLQVGDMIKTYADTSKLYKKINFKPDTNIKKGIDLTVKWYLNHIEKCEKTYLFS
ncbi:MAG TPA: NAD-dependent epimerase/dehydratase family protein [Flavobacteriales bacterium]|nr:NAD-dependent epimerase/dehydratase family protein [Flavobacteriales bacterium]